jgi:hypothetical protein
MVIMNLDFDDFKAACTSTQTKAVGKEYLTTFPILITGSRHSSMFTDGFIEAGVTIFTAFREDSFSNKEARHFEVRANDSSAVVLCANDHDPAGPGLTDNQRKMSHGGYLAYGTAGRECAVELMDSNDIGRFIKVMCVYADTTNTTWVRREGRGCSAYEGQAFVFVDPSEKANLTGKVNGILTKHGLV